MDRASRKGNPRVQANRRFAGHCTTPSGTSMAATAPPPRHVSNLVWRIFAVTAPIARAPWGIVAVFFWLLYSSASLAQTQPCPFPAWSSSAIYVGGNRVTYQTSAYEAKWWTQNETPTRSPANGASGASYTTVAAADRTNCRQRMPARIARSSKVPRRACKARDRMLTAPSRPMYGLRPPAPRSR